MPNLIGANGTIASGTGSTTFARNFEKAIETSKMGTRELAVLVVDMNTDVGTDYTEPGSLFSKAVQGLQTAIELFVIFPPSGAGGQRFTVLAAVDTIPFNAGQTVADGDEITALETAVDNATGQSTTIWNAVLDDDNITYND